jgi:hypothetical protein
MRLLFGQIFDGAQIQDPRKTTQVAENGKRLPNFAPEFIALALHL